MTNFDFLLTDPQFNSFAPAAVAAEKIFQIDLSSCIVNCRRAMEFAVKWMYSVDGSLILPYDTRLYSLIHNEDFRDIVGTDIWTRMELIRTLGNDSAHQSQPQTHTRQKAELCLENLYIFLDFVACCYGASYTEGQFNPALLDSQPEPTPTPVPEVDLEKLLEENRAMREELTARRETQQQAYVPKPLELTEYETRKIYHRRNALQTGWTAGRRDWAMNTAFPAWQYKSGDGFADYCLLRNTPPLPFLEASDLLMCPRAASRQSFTPDIRKRVIAPSVIFLPNVRDAD